MKFRNKIKDARLTFREICEQAKLESIRLLAEKATTANRIAKIATCPIDRALAYRVKDNAINQGISLGLFAPRSDNEGRPFLLSINCNGPRLHLPISRLSKDNHTLPIVTALLGRSTKVAA